MTLTASISAAEIDEPRYAAAPELRDIHRPVRVRSGIAGLVFQHPTTALGLAIIAFMIVLAACAPLLGTVDPTALSPVKRTRAPSMEYWFGTDAFGRDIYSRVIYGARVSLIVGFSVAILASAIGLLIGLISGFVRAFDSTIMRAMDGLMSIPPILLAVALMALTRASVQNVVLAITVAEIPRVSRLVRGVVLTLREQPYVDAAIASGSTTPMIIKRHILPNTLAPLTVQATYICGSAMIIESILSFIGAGTPPMIPSWGNIMADGAGAMAGEAVYYSVPGIVSFADGAGGQSVGRWVARRARSAHGEKALMGWHCSKLRICKRTFARRTESTVRSTVCRSR